MPGFDDLWALTRAAQACNGLSREFVEHFGVAPTFSTSAPAAISQARQRVASAEKSADRIERAIEKWGESVGALDFVGPAVGISLGVINVDGLTYQTAHEAAVAFAEAVVKRFQRSNGRDDQSVCVDLANQLADMVVPDLSGRIDGEHFAASGLAPLDEVSDEDGGGIGLTARARALETLMGPDTAEILKVVESGKNSDGKMRAICAIDRLLIYNGVQWWVDLLGKSHQAIEKTPFWKKDRPAAIDAMKAMRE